nr:homeobox-DDT domain protein RLT1 [Ipomoea batatas]
MGYASINDIQKVESTALDRGAHRKEENWNYLGTTPGSSRGAAPQICKYRCTSFHRLPWITALIDEAQQWRRFSSSEVDDIPPSAAVACDGHRRRQQRRHANELAEAFPCFRRQWQSFLPPPSRRRQPGCGGGDAAALRRPLDSRSAAECLLFSLSNQYGALLL